jgi:hypothetical protein
MLLNPEPSHIPHAQRKTRANPQPDKRNPSLRIHTAAKRPARDHQRADEPDGVERDASPARGTVQTDPARADSGHEGQYREQGGGQDAGEVQHEAEAVAREARVVEAFAWCGGGGEGVAEAGWDVEVREAGEGDLGGVRMR